LANDRLAGEWKIEGVRACIGKPDDLGELGPLGYGVLFLKDK
jgi:hypothetical protein